MSVEERVAFLENEFQGIGERFTDHERRVFGDVERRLEALESELKSAVHTNNTLLLKRLGIDRTLFSSSSPSSSSAALIHGKGKEKVETSEIIIEEGDPDSNDVYACIVTYKWPLVCRIVSSRGVRQLGRNNGKVILGQFPRRNLNVVVKLFDTTRDNEDESYQSELVLFPLLYHPNIIEAFGCSSSETGRTTAILYQYAENGSLQSHIGELDWGTILKTFEGIASALKYLHDLGYVHRDVKPPNILFTHDYTPKLADFGSAKLDKSDEYSMTPGYVDPDIKTGSSNSRVYTYHDNYSLGVTILQLIANWKTPFHPHEPATTIAKWAKKEDTEGRSIISGRLQGEWSEDREQELVNLVLSLTNEPDQRPELVNVISRIKEFQKTYDEDKKKKTTKKKKSKKVFKFLRRRSSS